MPLLTAFSPGPRLRMKMVSTDASRTRSNEIDAIKDALLNLLRNYYVMPSGI